MLGFREPFARLFHQGWLTMGGTKMSKSKGNVSGPNELVAEWGADPVRLYILFMGPADQDMEWTQDGIEGMARFVRRLWRVVNEVAARAPTSGDGPLVRKAHQTIQRVSDDLDRRMQFHTPISAVMELVNDLADDTAAPGRAVRRGDRGVAAAAVGAAHRRGAVGAARQRAPVGAAVAGGRPGAARARHLRARHPGERQGARPDRGAGRPVRGRARRARAASEKVQAQLDGKEIRKTIVVPGKLVNLVVG